MAPKVKLKNVEKIIVEAYIEHARTMKELATFHFVSVGTIRAILKRNGVPSRPQGRRRNDGKDLEQYKEAIDASKEKANAQQPTS